MRAFCGAALLVLVACDGGGDGPAGLDLSGRYNVQISGISGCGEDPATVAWAMGPLLIDADAVFDFGAPYVLSGQTTSSGGFTFSGEVDDEAGLSWQISGSGNADGAPGSYTLAGTVSGSSPDCTVQATFTAPQIGTE